VRRVALPLLPQVVRNVPVAGGRMLPRAAAVGRGHRGGVAVARQAWDVRGDPGAASHAARVRYAAGDLGSGRTTTVSATGMISSAARSARAACSRIASGLLAW